MANLWNSVKIISKIWLIRKKGDFMKYKGKIFNKIIIVGSAGSGKSYLSKLIAKYTNQPLSNSGGNISKWNSNHTSTSFVVC